MPQRSAMELECRDCLTLMSADGCCQRFFWVSTSALPGWWVCAAPRAFGTRRQSAGRRAPRTGGGQRNMTLCPEDQAAGGPAANYEESVIGAGATGLREAQGKGPS